MRNVSMHDLGLLACTPPLVATTEQMTAIYVMLGKTFDKRDRCARLRHLEAGKKKTVQLTRRAASPASREGAV